MPQQRKKKRTQKQTVPGDLQPKLPKSFVIRSGAVGRSVCHLVKDVRRIMEPNTAIKLRERRGNKLKDFANMAGPLGVSHIMIFSRTESHLNMRLARFPRGPTLSFHVNEYSLMRDIAATHSKPKSPGTEFSTPPLVVLNNFGSDERHVKLVSTMFQHMFPPINVQTMKLADARRVVLFNRDPETGSIDLRHFIVTVRVTGVSKTIKTLLQANIPDLKNYDDISDYILRGGAGSDSEAEDAPDSTMSLPQNYVGRNNRKSEQRAIRLVEIGPRLNLSLVKIQADLCAGEVLYHSEVKKTPEEAKAIAKRKAQQAASKADRKRQQESNVAKKKDQKKALVTLQRERQREKFGAKSKNSDDEGDEDEDDDDDDEEDINMEEDSDYDME
ncbi:hypothetical protein SmJEL517_g02072 [Synchytrium microbalum]|uniref:Brix domain-containing protein n=1 Tax=Synchytrium microbalum TaxID=1806994 RepID=A0A507CBS5_9FUNG|nr:uncharacterized protein SmJEL517_g02072 [Synchytrium microbalum]TPX35456.1 hypothetical protein SmJEL517_g02072 [Synchytrium microbalum]